MRLADLNPKLEGTLAAGALRFDCPAGHAHKMRIPLGAGGWQATGTFPDTLSLSPSVNADHVSPITGEKLCCWHGHVTNGDVT